MAKIAVIKTGGKQYKVAEGSKLKIEKLDIEAGKNVKFDTLMIADGANINLGKPSLGDKVEAKVIAQGKNDKVTVLKYKAKTRYRKVYGHKQPNTQVEITKIS